ncbi:MAG: ABC transporter ATP-binding protein [Fluviicola sp.]
MAQKNKLNTRVFIRLLSYWKTYKVLFFLAVSTTIILAFIGPTRPYVIKYMIDTYVKKGGDVDMLWFWTVIVIIMLLAEGLFQFISSYFANLFAQSIIRDIRKKLMKHIMTFNIRYFDRTPVGTHVTRLVADMEAITDVFSAGMMAIIGDLLMLFIIVGWMFFLDWSLALLTLLPIPILIFATRIFARAVRKSYEQEREAVTRLGNFVNERLTGVSIVQLFNRQEKEFERFREINKKHRQAHFNSIWAYSIFFPVVEILSTLSVALLLVWAGVSVNNSVGSTSADLGTVTAFVLWIYMLYRPIRQLADKFNVLQRGTVRAERVFTELDREQHIQNDGKVIDVNFGADIHFKDVYFAYNDEDWVLKDLNLSIESGATVAFVGATGAGKTSIVNLIGRFYEFQKGTISFGDISITDIELSHLRRNVAFVLQDVFLFSDTIHNNITLNDPAITREQVIQAAKAVGAHDFISQLPGKYDYEVGERGGVLSVGQRQLLSFIRAYVYNPNILILDEATSSVDMESEHLIQEATTKITKGRTSIVIAHRLSTIQNADKIVVLDKGEIVEVGDHQELLAHKGYYRKLYDLQFSEMQEKGNK